ncbi:CYP2D6-containing [Ictidomys tridecemlineatus]|uniref:Cytochrome P450 n=1 Tax=Ictidomys tridecemlineatus TaxID=43179 RepID=A0A287CSD2_ICTTR|nr:CYP2D6-containing [Ictidomys tridecemlineatus]
MGLLTGPLCVAVAIFLLLVDLMHRRQRWAARYPPGPLPLLGLGNLLQIDFQNMPYPRYKVREMKWPSTRVLVNGLVAVYEVLKCSKYTVDHPPMPTYQHLGLGAKSGKEGCVVLATYGPAWREQQHFSISTMHNFSLGKKSLEQWVIEEVGHTLTGCPLPGPVCNVISSLIYAHHFENHDQRLAKTLGLLEDNLKEESGFMPEELNAVPVLLRIPGLPGRVFPAQKAFMAMVDELLEEHRMTWDPAQPPRDLTDAFLVEVEKGTLGSFKDKNLHGTLLSGPTLLAARILAPRIFWGQGLLPRVHGGVLISSLPVPAHGRHLLQGTMLITNLSSVLKDEMVWEKPLLFHPGCPGPLCEAGGLHAFLTPSTGRHACLGEPLARMELFLFFTCLLQRFSFSPSDRGVFAFIVVPSPDQLCAVLY